MNRQQIKSLIIDLEKSPHETWENIIRKGLLQECELCGCLILPQSSHGGPVVWEKDGEYHVKKRPICKGCNDNLKKGGTRTQEASTDGKEEI